MSTWSHCNTLCCLRGDMCVVTERSWPHFRSGFGWSICFCVCLLHMLLCVPPGRDTNYKALCCWRSSTLLLELNQNKRNNKKNFKKYNNLSQGVSMTLELKESTCLLGSWKKEKKSSNVNINWTLKSSWQYSAATQHQGHIYTISDWTTTNVQTWNNGKQKNYDKHPVLMWITEYLFFPARVQVCLQEPGAGHLWNVC